MKKKILMLLATCLFASACQIEEMNKENHNLELDNNDVFYASMEVKDSTKTSLDVNNNIRWSANDQLVIFRKTSLGLKYQIQDNYVGETSGYFSKVISGSSSDDFGAGMANEHNIAYYPYSDNVRLAKSGNDYNLKVSLPSVQSYAKGSFGNGTFAMAAVSADQDLTFKNVIGGIKLQFKGIGMVTSVKIEGNNEEKVAGDATVTVYTGESTPTISMGDNAFTSVVLDCGEGVQLNETTATEFIIALPPTVFETGFTITVTDPQDNEEIVTTNLSNEVLRSGMLVMPEVVLKDIEPKDYSINLSATETANSYIVSESGEYRFLTTRGNTDKTVGTVASAVTLWESFGTDVEPTIGELITNVKAAGRYIKFEVPESFKEGNAVIAAKDADGNILWSWHIWLTDMPLEIEYPNNAGVMMDRNLGATSVTQGNVTSYGLLYQWGRKDPFLNTSVSDDKTSVDDLVVRAASTGAWNSVVSSSSNGTIAYSINNPTTFICGTSYTYYDWLYSNQQITERWTSEKTQHDPCPAGWRVPTGGSVGNDGFWATAGFGSLSYDFINYGADITLSAGVNTWYPATGYAYSYSNNSSGYNLCGSGIYGNLWSATLEGYDAYAMHVDSDMIVPYTKYDRFHAYAVRCFKENSNIESSLPSQNPPKEGDYVDDNGVNHGQGVKIDGVEWAPVNVGAASTEKYGKYYGWNSAHKACPEGWRLPYVSELTALAQNYQAANVNGVNGCWLSGSKSTTNPSSAIFLPAAGDKNGNIQRESYGYYWSANSFYDSNGFAQTLNINMDSSPSIDKVFSTAQAIPVRCVRIQSSELAESQKTIDGLTWFTKNVGAQIYTEAGNYYTEDDLSYNFVCPEGWRVPTFDDFKALKQNYSDLVTVNGVSGRWFSGSNKTSDSSTGIFLPMAGYQYESNDDGTQYQKNVAWYWSGTVYASKSNWLFSYNDHNVSLDKESYSNRATPIRCVKGEYNGPSVDLAVSETPVVIDGLTWANKNVGAESVLDYGDTFTWEEALNACPEGWRLPTKDEMSIIVGNYSWDYLSGQCGIYSLNKDNDAVFFPAAQGGVGGYYWTSTQKSTTAAYALILSPINVGSALSTREYPVRCVQGEVDLGLEKTEGASYTLTLKPDGAPYGWKESTYGTPNPFMYDGLYEGTCGSDSYAVMYIDIVGYETFTFYIRNNGEKGFDYMMVSKLDKEITGATAYNDSAIKAYDKDQRSGTDLGSYTKVEYTGIDKGSHRITIVYRRDDEDSGGTNHGYVMIPIYQ